MRNFEKNHRTNENRKISFDQILERTKIEKISFDQILERTNFEKNRNLENTNERISKEIRNFSILDVLSKKNAEKRMHLDKQSVVGKF